MKLPHELEKIEQILFFLKMAIKSTSAGNDVTALRYIPEEETVHVDFESGADARIINVACDSNWAMIKDVINHIDIG